MSGSLRRLALSILLATTATVGCSSDPASPATVATVEVTPSAAPLEVGSMLALTGVPKDGSGHPVTATITWQTSDQSIATVSSNGQVSGVAVGPVTITATADGKSGTANLTVVPPADQVVASVTVTTGLSTLVVGQNTQAVAVGRNAAGLVVPLGPVTWTTSAPPVVTIDDLGRITGSVAGQATVTAAASGNSGSAGLTVTVPTDGRAVVVAAMEGDLPSYIDAARAEMEGLLPSNPGLTSQLQAKIALLSEPGLAASVIAAGLHEESVFRSLDDRWIPVVTFFPRAAMRDGAHGSVGMLGLAGPILEEFFAAPLPKAEVRMWYGFIVGQSNEDGVLRIEDREAYEARTTSSRLPHDAILAHELGHDFIFHEGLNQFLEIYAYNKVYTGSDDYHRWTYTRGHVPSPTNTGIHALLDVYLLIGKEAMARAYRAAYEVHPPYGQELSPGVRQLFVDQAPAAVRDQVRTLMDQVTF